MDLDIDNLHHAYLLIGDANDAEKSLHGLFENLKSSPDFFVYRDETFGVDLSRELSARALRKAFTGRKIFLIAPEKITFEAQNALLKTFEDPIAETHFFLVVRGEDLVIPTLRSRMQMIRLSGESSSLSKVEDFLKLSLKKRMDFVKKFVDKEENVSVFLDEMLSYLRSSGNTSLLEKVYKIRLISDARAASPRLILEHLSLML